jgi:hypothetical protein
VLVVAVVCFGVTTAAELTTDRLTSAGLVCGRCTVAVIDGVTGVVSTGGVLTGAVEVSQVSGELLAGADEDSGAEEDSSGALLDGATLVVQVSDGFGPPPA